MVCSEDEDCLNLCTFVVEVVFAGGWAVICVIESEDEVVLAIVLAFELVREVSVSVDELAGVAVVVDATGFDIEVVTPPGGYGHQLKLEVLDDSTDVASCRAMLIFHCEIDVVFGTPSTA